jgi:hypothetical protein
LWFDKGSIADLHKLRGSSWVEKSKGGRTACNRQQEEMSAGLRRAVTKREASPANNPSEHWQPVKKRGQLVSPRLNPLAETVPAGQQRGTSCWSVLNNKKR